MSKSISVVYIVTAQYKGCAERFYRSLHFLFPQYEKFLITLTDDTTYIDDLTNDIFTEEDNIEAHSHKIPDVPYPYINMTKFAYIEQFLKEDTDYTFYFDADTEILEKPETFWSILENKICTNKTLITSNVSFSSAFYKEVYDPSQHAHLMYDVEASRLFEPAHSPIKDRLQINDRSYRWAQTCLICGKTTIIQQLMHYCNERIPEMTIVSYPGQWIKSYYIPLIYDESVMNKIIYDAIIGQITEFDFSVESYAVADKETEREDITFCYQKMLGGKFKKHS